MHRSAIILGSLGSLGFCYYGYHNNVNKVKKTSDKLNSIQEFAFKGCNVRAKNANDEMVQVIESRFKNLGLTYDDVINVMDKIKNADVIIHFSGSSAKWLGSLEESRYKNYFETSHGNDRHHSNNKSYRHSRLVWESKLFDKAYDESEPWIKVKYGCLNIMSDAIGCRDAIGCYGNSFMILKPDIKSRTSFTFDDSCKNPEHICTFDNFIQVFSKMNDRMIKDIILMTKKNLSKDDLSKDRRYYTYIEAQIHGDIVIKRDVEHIMLYHEHTTPEILERLKKDNIPFTVFGHNNVCQNNTMLSWLSKLFG